VLIALIEPTAEASFALILASLILGIAIAAMIRMIASTIINSSKVNPLVSFIVPLLIPSCDRDGTLFWIRLADKFSLSGKHAFRPCDGRND
jgi:hypothetical protein